MKQATERNAEMLNLRNEGLTYSQIGERFGISRQRVKVVLDSLTNHSVPTLQDLAYKRGLNEGIGLNSTKWTREFAARGGICPHQLTIGGDTTCAIEGDKHCVQAESESLLYPECDIFQEILRSLKNKNTTGGD